MTAGPVSVALIAGGLAVINPCGFPLLPAFLSFYLGADEHQLPRAPTQIVQGLLVGALVSIGFLGLFALASLPVSFGVALVARLIPWAGLATGALLALAGLVSSRRSSAAVGVCENAGSGQRISILSASSGPRKRGAPRPPGALVALDAKVPPL